MSSLREAATLALEALELEATDPPLPETAAAMDALRAALAEVLPNDMTEEELAAYRAGWQKRSLIEPQRKWVGLTEQDFSAINQSCLTKLQAATSAESILKEKNA